MNDWTPQEIVDTAMAICIDIVVIVILLLLFSYFVIEHLA